MSAPAHTRHDLTPPACVCAQTSLVLRIVFVALHIFAPMLAAPGEDAILHTCPKAPRYAIGTTRGTARWRTMARACGSVTHGSALTGDVALSRSRSQSCNTHVNIEVGARGRWPR
jgi:hypothetical protein